MQQTIKADIILGLRFLDRDKRNKVVGRNIAAGMHTIAIVYKRPFSKVAVVMYNP